MSIAKDIIQGIPPDVDAYLREGGTIDDIDEYGFTALIECAITNRIDFAEDILKRGAAIDKPDVTGRTALHWAVDNINLDFTRMLLSRGANPNTYTRSSCPILVHPLLRHNNAIKQALYQHGASLDFALDFIYGKLLGHRYELTGDVDIVNADGEFIELNFEGFILEFTVEVLRDALRRFVGNYSTRRWRPYFSYLHQTMDAFKLASDLLRWQRSGPGNFPTDDMLAPYLAQPLLILPVACAGHAIGFLRYGPWWAKVDRGENSQHEPSATIYRMTHPERFNAAFLRSFLYQKQQRVYYHRAINQFLGLKPVTTLPIDPQITGNCSWSNIQGLVLAACTLLHHDARREHMLIDEPLKLYQTWVEWDQDRALDECIQRFYRASPARKASIAAMLASVLFQTCDAENPQHLARAERILPILVEPGYRYILDSYIEVYCVKKLSRRGNNLLKILDYCGVDSGVDVTPIATKLKKRRQSK